MPPRPARGPSHARATPPERQPTYTRHDRHRLAQNADHLALNVPFSAFFAEVVCSLGTTSAPNAASAPAIGGIALHGGPTRRRHASRGLHVVQNPHQCRDIERSSWAGRKPHTPQCPTQTNVARNFSLSFFEHTRKHCNFNDLYSQLEAPPGELRATLPESINVAQNDDYPQCIATTFPYRSS